MNYDLAEFEYPNYDEPKLSNIHGLCLGSKTLLYTDNIRLLCNDNVIYDVVDLPRCTVRYLLPREFLN